MSTTVSPAVARRVRRASARDRIGLVVVGAIGTGLVLGLALVLVVLAGGPEHAILGAALLSLGTGFVVLAVGADRLTRQPQSWALRPGLATIAGGAAVWALAPGDRALALAGWAWPVLLLALVVRSYRGARRTLHHWSRGALLHPSLLVLLLVAGGGAFQAVSAAASADRAPGRSFLVDGQRLYLHCTGSGGPTVVLFNGLGERTPSWAWVQHRVATTTRVCAFDRAGEGWSGSSAAGRDGNRLAADLHGLLRAARVPGPYVLAGHSVGGVYALVYAERYPRDVAGVALIDSATPYQFELPDYPRFYALGRRLYSVMPVLAHIGLGRATAAGQFGTLPAAARRAARAFASSPRELAADRADFAELPTVFAQARALTTLGDKPLVVVTAGVGTQRGWTSAQQRLARLSRHGGRRTVVGATHAALLEDEGFAWITGLSIEQVVRAARARPA